ncbi:hypothetical protein VIBNISO65_p0102 [Vibrio nigripulchritudo SO65]|nr:hypothetical protein VIBNIAM115_p0100 [Vibrio nigripulchritudo AM115]CCN45000.1 hypothetical protein VIBNIFTn2_p0099 [Vibrio nigripulchritudo FTn2]CCN79758.1 hypothetical protein VIBNISO65_p0102 [Vibrio nigripulchritudo SO65]
MRSHTCVQMIETGIKPVIVENLCNAKEEMLNRTEALAGNKPAFYLGYIRDEAFLGSVFSKHDITVAIHFKAASLLQPCWQTSIWQDRRRSTRYSK